MDGIKEGAYLLRIAQSDGFMFLRAYEAAPVEAISGVVTYAPGKIVLDKQIKEATLKKLEKASAMFGLSFSKGEKENAG